MSLTFGRPAINPVWPTFTSVDQGDPRRGTFSTGATYDPKKTSAYSSSNLAVGVPVTAKPLSFDKSIRSYTGGKSAVPASFPNMKPSTKSGAIFGDIGNFLSTLSTGYDAGDTRSNPAVYDDAILRQARIPTPIASSAPSTVAGGAFDLSSFKGIAKGIIGSMGSSGDGDIVPVSYGAVDQASTVSPWMIAAGAAAVGAVIYFASK